MNGPSSSLASLLVLATLLVAPSLAALPTAPSAPAPLGVAPADDDGPPQGESLLPDATNATVVVEDDENDASLGLPLVGSPGLGTDADAPVDIVTVTVAETEGQILVSLKNRGYPSALGTAYSSGFLAYWYCGVSFSLNDEGHRGYDLWMMLEQDAGSEPYTTRVELNSFWEEDDNNWEGEYIGQVESALVGGDHIEMVLEKALLGVGSNGRPLRVGDELSDFFVWCNGGLGPTYTYDDFWEESTPFEVQQAAGTSDLALSFPESADGVAPVTVAAGRVTKVPMRVENLLSRKVLVNLTAEVVDASGAPLSGWNVTNVGTLEIKANRGFDATLLIGAPASAKHRDGGLIRVTARPIGSDAPAIVTRALQAVVTPSPANNVLYFHNSPNSQRFCLPSCGDVPVPALIEAELDQFYLNVLAQDPVYGEANTEEAQPALITQNYVQAIVDAPFADRVRFDPDAPSTLTLSVRRDLEGVVEAQVYVWTDGSEGDDLVAEGTGSATVGSTYTPLEITLRHNEDATTLDTGSFLGVEVQFMFPDYPEPFSFVGIGEMEFDPAGSSLALSLLEAPLTVLEQSDGRVLPNLYLQNETETEEYVNPTESQSFELALSNEGTLDDVLEVKATVDLPGWKVTFVPGASFELEPGSTAPICMAITAPEGAREDDRAHVNLTATARANPDIVDTLAFLLIVTNQDIDDDPCGKIETQSEDYVAPYTPAPKDTPAVGFALTVAGIAAALALSRRRRLA